MYICAGVGHLLITADMSPPPSPPCAGSTGSCDQSVDSYLIGDLS